MKTIIINHRSNHHAKHSGYDQLGDYVTSDKISGKQHLVPYKIAKYIAGKTNKSFGIYNSNSFYKDLKLAFKLLNFNPKKKVIHYLNAERDIRLAIRLKPYLKNTKICATFHKPPNVLHNQIKDFRLLKQLDGAIAVGDNQLSFLKDSLGLKNVVYIPHGIDVNFFIPKHDDNAEKSILFVGQHLRDFNTFNSIVSLMENKNIKVNVALREDFKTKIKPSKIVTIYTNLSDVELLQLYQKSTLLFLPLLDSTACNSILEAMACGLPIITSNVGGNSSYLKETDSVLLNNESAEDILDIITQIINDKSLQKKMGDSVRKKALNYDWKEVSKQIEVFYNQLH